MNVLYMCAIVLGFVEFFDSVVLTPVLFHAVVEIRYWRWTQSVFDMLLSARPMLSSVNVALDQSVSL